MKVRLLISAKLGRYPCAGIVQKFPQLYHRMGHIDWVASNHCLFGLPGRDYPAKYHLDVEHRLLPQALSGHAYRVGGARIRGHYQHCW